MATLTEVIRTTESTIGNFIGADALLEWSDEALRLALEPCSQVKLITWRHTEEALSPPEFLGHDIVGILQVIYNHLETAASRSDCLRGGTTDQPQPPNRRAVLLALNDVLHGFKAFSGISGTPVGLVFSYLKKCYEYHLIFARLLFPKGSTNSFAGHEEYYRLNLNGFKLNSQEDRAMVENPTLSGIIIDQTSMPATCLPRYRVPQTLVRTRGLYGPALQRNHFYDMQPQEIGLTVEEG